MTAMHQTRDRRVAGGVQAERSQPSSAAAMKRSCRPPSQHGIEIPHLCYRTACARTATAARAWSRSRASARSPRPAAAFRATAWRSRPIRRARCARRRWCSSCCSPMSSETEYTLDSELDQWAKKLEVGQPRFAAREQPRADLSHPAIAVNLDACIQCTRCLRACREEQVNDVIGFAFRGEHSKIVFDLDDPMGASTCVACGECVQACPTGALAPARQAALTTIDRTVDSVCPYCGVGCQLTYHIKDEQDRLRARPRRAVQPRPSVREGPLRLRLRASQASADQAADPQAGRPEDRGFHRRSEQLAGGVPRGELGRGARFRRRRACGRFAMRIGTRALAGFGSAKGSQRGGVPFPEARAHRLRLEQRRSLHAPVPRLVGRRADGGHQFRRGVQPGARRDACRGRSS